jgi:rhodanese-related sulfurtransferase
MKSLMIAMVVASLGLIACEGPPSRSTDAPELAVKSGVSEMSPSEARPGTDAAYSQFIDVRTPEEYSAGHAYRAVNIPLDTLSQNLDRIEKNEPVYLICATGRRSMQAAQMLSAAGYPRVINVAGGTAAWREAGLPMDPPAAPKDAGPAAMPAE